MGFVRMMIDLTSTGPRAPIDVRAARYLYVQAQPGGDVGSAVLSLRRAFSADPHAPDVEFGSGVVADLAGGVVTLDVTDTAYVRPVCTTAASGASVDLAFGMSGTVEGETFSQTVDLTSPGPRASILAAGYDRAFVAARVPLTNTAALAVRESQDPAFVPQDYADAVSVALNGTVTEIPLVSSVYAVPVCTTAQSGQSAELFWYARGPLSGPSETARVSLSSTTGSFTTTAATVPLNRVDLSAPWASLSAGVVTLKPGRYTVLADITTNEASGNNRTEFGSVAQTDASGSYVDVPGTERRHYSRLNVQGGQTASISFAVTIEKESSVRVQSRRVSGTNTGEWIADGSSMTITRT